MSDYEYIDKGCEDGTVLGKAATSLVGFWGATPCDQAAALTAAWTTISMSVSASVPDYAIASATATTGFGFVNQSEAATFLCVVANIQVRVEQVETALNDCGLIAGGAAVDTSSGKYDFIGAGGGGDGMVLGQSTAAKIGFWGTAPVDQPATLTAALSAITCTAEATTSTQISIFTSASGTYGFSNMEEFLSLIQVVINAQTRMASISSRLVELGILAGGTALTSTTAYDYLSKGNDDGTILGTAGAKLGFYATTPVVQPSALTTAYAIITVTAVSTDYLITIPTSDGSYKPATLNEIMTLVSVIKNAQTRVGEIETALKNTGLIASS